MEDWLARNIQDPIGSFHTETLPGLPGKIWGAHEQAARAIGGAAKDVFTGCILRRNASRLPSRPRRTSC